MEILIGARNYLTMIIIWAGCLSVDISSEHETTKNMSQEWDDSIDLVEIFGYDGHCLISIHNYDHIDIVGPSVPIQLNTLPETWLINPRFSIMSDDSSMSIVSGIKEGINETILGILPESRFWKLVKTKRAKSTFASIDVSEFLAKSRPWNCYVQMDLSPVNYTNFEIRYYPRTLYFPVSSPILRYTFPSSVPPVHILVVGIVTAMDERLGFVQHERNAALYSWPAAISRELLFLVKVSEAKLFMSTIFKIYSIKMAKSCTVIQRHAVHNDIEFYNVPSFSSVSRNAWRKLSAVECQSSPNNNILAFNIKVDAFPMKTHVSIENSIYDVATEFWSCRNFRLEDILDGKYINYPSVRMARAYVNVWWSIMGNFTYWTPDNLYCTGFGNSLTSWISMKTIQMNILPFFISQVSGSQMFPVVSFERPLQNLKFVGCGARGLSGFAFDNLLNVFKKEVWLVMLVTMVILPLLMYAASSVPCSLNVDGWYFAFLAVAWLEQGSLLPNKLWCDSRLRWVVGSFILAGIVMSNAYKNTNVYNMILPRKIIPFENFQELLDHNFKIYTSIGYSYFTLLGLFDMDIETYLRDLHVENHLIYQNNTYGSTLFKITSVVSNKFEAMKIWNLTTNEEFIIDKTLLAETSLGSHAYNITWDTMKAASDWLNNAESTSILRKLGSMITHYLDDLDHKESARFLETCDKTAIIEPEFQCIKHAQFLRRQGHKHVFIGKELYFMTKLAFALEGDIPEYIIKRIRATDKAALFSRWIDLLKGTAKEWFQEAGRLPLVPPTISGNVLIIFMIWEIGVVVTLVCIFLEITIYKYIILKAFVSNENYRT